MDEIIKERLLRRLKENAVHYWHSNTPDKVMREMYLQDPNGCINEDYLSDDLNKAIFDKFYAVVDAVRQEAGIEGVEIYIDVSYDDSTTYLMIVGDRVLLKGHAKAWTFWWETEEELVEELYRMYCQVSSDIRVAAADVLLDTERLKYALMERMQEDGVNIPDEPAVGSLVKNFASFLEDALPDWVTKQYALFDIPAYSED